MEGAQISIDFCSHVPIDTRISFFFLLRFYLFIHRHTHRQRHREREKQAPCREPDVGLDPGSPGSHPRLQAVLNRCATGAALFSFDFIVWLDFCFKLYCILMMSF